MDAATYARRSDLIVGRIQALAEVQRAETIHVFWPIHRRREVDVRSLIAWLYTQKKQIVLPVVGPRSDTSQKDWSRDEMALHLEHRRFESEDALVRSNWGISEPVGGELVPVEHLDAVIVPALGVDRQGNRLGYGRGYYDQFLRGLSIPTICPIFQQCLEASIPREAHDVPVRVIVTENEVLRVSRS